MDNQKEDFVVSYLTLRQMIGWIGFVMPFAVRIGAYLAEGIKTTDSISAYYYTGMRDVFVSTLVLVGVLLTCYRTPSRRDNVVAIIAGIAAMGIGLFPMQQEFAAEILTKYPQMAVKAACYVNRGYLGYHFIFVTVFFALSCYLVYFRFDAFTPVNATAQKLTRNRIYKGCGLIMMAAFSVIGVLATVNKGGSIFWPESVAVLAFAAAWLVKGQTILKDGLPA